MDADRKTMEAMLKRGCVPVLRDMGFKGAFPHFHRETGRFVALVTVQFGSAGGSFCVNLGYADPSRRNVYHTPGSEPAKLRVSQTRDWVRLGAGTAGDRWFVFGSAAATAYRGSVRSPEEIATECAELLRSEAEAWWARKQREAV
ncbi:MAG TPA: DUF4304 domain-containing protein [Tabrizicola sp.]